MILIYNGINTAICCIVTLWEPWNETCELLDLVLGTWENFVITKIILLGLNSSDLDFLTKAG